MAQRESSDELPMLGCHFIVPNGDLIMAFLSDPPDVKNLLVSQHVFRQSSEVFATLLVDSIHKNPPPSDGVCLFISFDDDLARMEVIVNILHLRNHLVPSRVTFPMLYGLAVIIHKYDLARAIGPWWVKEWCHEYLEIIEREEFSRWLFIATVLRQRASFTRITRHLILSSRIDSHNGKLVTEHGQSFTTDVDPSIIDQIKDSRTSAGQFILSCWRGKLQELQRGPHTRVCPQMNVFTSTERSDTERARCDTVTLDILKTTFPDDGLGMEGDLLVRSIFDMVNDIRKKSNDMNCGVLESHYDHSSVVELLRDVATYVESVQGLELIEEYVAQVGPAK